MSIIDLFADASGKALKAPMRLFPRCHPKEKLDVYIDGKKKIVVLCCSKCDRPMVKITNGKIVNL